MALQQWLLGNQLPVYVTYLTLQYPKIFNKMKCKVIGLQAQHQHVILKYMHLTCNMTILREAISQCFPFEMPCANVLFKCLVVETCGI